MSKWTGFRLAGGESSGWKLGSGVSIVAPTAISSSLPSMYIPLDGADAAVLRPLAVGSAGSVVTAVSIYGMNTTRSTNYAYNPALPFNESSNNPISTIHTAILLSGCSNMTLGTVPATNAWNRSSPMFFDTITTELTAGTQGVLNDNAFSVKTDTIAQWSQTAGIAEFLFGNLERFDGLGIGVVLINTVTEFAMAYNLRT